MMLIDEIGEIAAGAGDEFHVASKAGGTARLELLFQCQSMSKPGAPVLCCRLKEGKLIIDRRTFGLTPGFGLMHLIPPAIVYLRGVDVARALRAFRGHAMPPDLQVLAVDVVAVR